MTLISKWHFMLTFCLISSYGSGQTIKLEKTKSSVSTNGSVTVDSRATAVIKNCSITAKQDVILNGNVKIVNAKIECNVLRFNASSVTIRGKVTIICNRLDLGTATHALKGSALGQSKLIVTATDIIGNGSFSKTARLTLIYDEK